MKATLSPDRLSFHLKGPTWDETIPVRFLDGRLAFYTHLRHRANGRYADHYAETVQQLRAVKRALRGPSPPPQGPGHPGGGGPALPRAA